MLIKNRNLFRLTRFIIFKLPKILKIFCRLRKPQKRLLIIKTEAIGDYVFFRNFIEEVRLSPRFKGYQIDLLGNKLWRDIALTYDNSFVDDFLFIVPDELYEAPFEVLRLSWRLFKKNYAIVLQPTFSRTLIIDGLAGLTAAEQIIGFVGDTERIAEKYKVETDKFYSRKLIIPDDCYFEFHRSKFFFETVLDHPIKIKSPGIKINKTNKNGIVIFPGAGSLKRNWESEKFVLLINKLSEHTSQPIYLSGDAKDLPLGEYIITRLPQNSVINMIGKTTLTILIEMIANAELVIANETSAVHIAAATKTKSICILGGGHFERFAPYPEDLEYKPVCIFDKLECYYCNWECKFQTNAASAYPCIAGIGIEKVFEAAMKMIN